MARPPLPLGTPGSITVSERGPGSWEARCRFRDHDGLTRRLCAVAATKTAARSKLHDTIRSRKRGRAQADALTPGSTFAEAAAAYLAKIKRKREDTTYVEYKARLDNYVLPGLGALRLRECSPGRLDAFFEQLEHRGFTTNTRRNVRTVVSGVMQQAVLHDALDQNPVREIERIEQPRGKKKVGPRGLTLDERRRLLSWLDACSPDPSERRLQQVARRAEFPDLVRFFLGTGLRIGEGLAVRRLDVNLEGLPAGGSVVPVVAVTENLVWSKGKGLVRHGGKTDAALRVIPLPSFAVDVIRPRLAAPGEPWWPLFPTSGAAGEITYRWPANVRRTLRAVREQVDLGWMTPHTWRRTYATILDDDLTLTDRMKADLMGHAKFLKNDYVSRGELHPNAAVVLDSALA